MAWFEYIDIMFFITSLHHRSDRFDILRYVTITFHCTRSSDKVTIHHTFSKSCLSRHFFFNRLPSLWNALPFIDINNPIITFSLSRIFRHHLPTLHISDTIKSALLNPPLMAYQRAHNLKDYLMARASIRLLQQICKGNRCCGRPRCKTCAHIKLGKCFTIAQ